MRTLFEKLNSIQKFMFVAYRDGKVVASIMAISESLDKAEASASASLNDKGIVFDSPLLLDKIKPFVEGRLF